MRKAILAAALGLLVLAAPSAAPDREVAGMEAGARVGGLSDTLVELNTLYHYLETYSLYGVDEEVVGENLTKAIMASLDDDYAAYLTGDDAEDMDQSISGSYVGIGVYVTKRDPAFADFEDEESWMLQVTSPFPGGPADLAGIRARDLISHIDGESVAALDADEAAKLLRGEEGVEMTLKVHRGGNVIEIKVTPEQVNIPSVDHGMIPGANIGYLSIADFTEATYEMVSEALLDLSSKGMEALVIDLRNNSGGVVQSALMVANFFVDDGDSLVRIEYREGSGQQDTLMVASDQTRKVDAPVAILVNGGTASASEILSAALRDNGKAVLVGEKTFGKGIIQDVMKWNDGYIRFTTAHYLTPAGDDIHEVGVEPDIPAAPPELADEELDAYYDFLSDHSDAASDWVAGNPEYSEENIKAFADQWESGAGFDPYYLEILVRNAYISEMDYEDRPLVDLVRDGALRAAVDHLSEGL